MALRLLRTLVTILLGVPNEKLRRNSIILRWLVVILLVSCMTSGVVRRCTLRSGIRVRT